MPEFAWLGIVRHGQSVGNILADQAEAAGAAQIDVPQRDADVPLSELGGQQAAVIGQWLAGLPDDARPDAVISSPYRRAMQTAEIARGALPAPAPMWIDERLRDRELGILDRLTRLGVAQRFPDEEARRRFLGKLYYRPPGGESWADVALRLRSVLRDIRAEYADRRVLLFAHEATVFLLRYIIEGLTEAQLMELAGRPLANAALTSWELADGRLRLTSFDGVAV